MTSKELEKIIIKPIYSSEAIPDIKVYRETEKLVNESIVRFVRYSIFNQAYKILTSIQNHIHTYKHERK